MASRKEVKAGTGKIKTTQAQESQLIVTKRPLQGGKQGGKQGPKPAPKPPKCADIIKDNNELGEMKLARSGKTKVEAEDALYDEILKRCIAAEAAGKLKRTCDGPCDEGTCTLTFKLGSVPTFSRITRAGVNLWACVYSGRATYTCTCVL